MRKIIFTLIFIAVAIAANAQLKITRINGIKGTYTEHLAYPLVHSAGIDSLLQFEILNNEQVVTDRKKIFNNTVFIREPDSLAQSGHTAFDYEILLNNTQALSIRFDLESLGAYPENYKRYFCFDAQTGNILTPKELFTPAGIQYLQSYLRSERAKRIKVFLQGELPDMEDSAFARERYEECNSEAELEQFAVRKQNILFYKEHCFPHAWRPFDIDLDVTIGFARLEKYLTSKGKKLLGL